MLNKNTWQANFTMSAPIMTLKANTTATDRLNSVGVLGDLADCKLCLSWQCSYLVWNAFRQERPAKYHSVCCILRGHNWMLLVYRLWCTVSLNSNFAILENLKLFSIIVGFFNSVSTCISEQVFSHLEGMCSDFK